MSEEGGKALHLQSPTASQEGLSLYVKLVQVSKIKGTSDSQVRGDEMDGGELPANLKTHYHFRLQKHQESNSLPTRLFGGIESLKND